MIGALRTTSLHPAVLAFWGMNWALCPETRGPGLIQLSQILNFNTCQLHISSQANQNVVATIARVLINQASIETIFNQRIT